MTSVDLERSAHVDPEDLGELEAILAQRSIRPLYQPIVDLHTQATVGWEALARGPQGSRLEFPDRLFGVAAELGRLDELDFVCRVAAVRGALAAGLGRQQELFVNVEPSVTTTEVPDFLIEARQDAQRYLRTTVEITERALTANPAELIALVGLYRRYGWGIALDDVGVDPRSVSLMPFIRPDVIKLDMAYVQEPITRERARTLHAVSAEAERSGTRVLAEGIETEAHLTTARSLGAHLGQGWHFGRPGAITPGPSAGEGTGRVGSYPAPSDLATTPFAILQGARPVRTATKSQTLEMSLALEEEALMQGEAVVLLGTFQEASFFTRATRARYEAVAKKAAFVGALAVDLGSVPAPGVRGAQIAWDDPLRGEWTVVVLGPHFAAAFAARDLEDPDTTGMGRRFEYALTYDRALVTAIATNLMQRIAPALD